MHTSIDSAQRLLLAAVVRVSGAEGPVGAGVLIGSRQLLTCTHVVSAALGYEREPQSGDVVAVDFPLVRGRPTDRAQVQTAVPISPDGGGDVALLQLMAAPPGTNAARLVMSSELFDDPYAAIGFPQGHSAGVWSTGRLLRGQGSGWWQLEATKVTGMPIEAGFSGAPVWDERLGGVVGLLVTQVRRSDARTAFMVPLVEIAQLLPQTANIAAATAAEDVTNRRVDIDPDDWTRRQPGRRGFWRSILQGDV